MISASDNPTGPLFDRRSFGCLALCAGGTALLTTSVGACSTVVTEDVPPELLGAVQAAQQDGHEFTAADESLGPLAPLIRQIGQARLFHAEQLFIEIDRLYPQRGDDVGNAMTVEDGAVFVCPPVAQVRERLQSAGDSAAELAIHSTGFHASLTASVAASCRAATHLLPL